VEDLAFSDDGETAIAILDAQVRPHLMALDVASGDDLSIAGESDGVSGEPRVAGLVPGGAEHVIQDLNTAGSTELADGAAFDSRTGEFQEWLDFFPLASLLERPVWSADGQTLVTVGRDGDGQFSAVLWSAE
jgi:hypothetical protein